MTKITINQLAILLLGFIVFQSCNGPVSYYISSDGDDSNSGTSQDQSWQTISKVNQTVFKPGDRIMFRGGDTFEGTIRIDGLDAGSESSRLEITSYGAGRAVISGGNEEGLVADSCIYLTIENLEFSGIGRNSGNTSDGVVARQCDGIVLHDLKVHGFQHSGVHVHQCNDATITHVHAFENGFSGIHVTGATMQDPENYDNHNLYIGYCVAENNPGDPTVLKNHSGNGILASSVRGGTIEYCEAFNNGWDMVWTGNGPVGIWIWDCTEFTIQYCIAHHNRTNPVAADGGGFDFDGGVSNSVIQYCIAHDNEGAGFGLYEFGAAKPWENNTVRYNISQDDGIINGGSVGIWKNDGRGIMRNCNIYNNTFYNSKEEGSNIWLYDHYPNFFFYNNVFVYNGELIAESQSISEEVFSGNLYWNLAGRNEIAGDQLKGYFLDPLFTDAGALRVTDPEQINRENLSCYLPLPGSPLINQGLDLSKVAGLDPGEKDILGTPVPAGEHFDIGAIEIPVE